MLHLDSLDGLVFETDRNGTILATGGQNWNAFAAENGAPELLSDAVIGQNLFNFIEGKAVRDQIRKILDRISQDPNWAWVLPFRCDAPQCHRNILQSLRPVFSEEGCTGFVFHSFHQSSRQRAPIGLYDFKRHRELAKEHPSLPSVIMCSWCQRVQFPPVAGTNWVTAEVYYARGGQSDVRLSHGICEDCLETTLDPMPAEECASRERKR